MTRRLRISEVHERVQPFFERYGAEVMFERGAGEEDKEETKILWKIDQCTVRIFMG